MVQAQGILQHPELEGGPFFIQAGPVGVMLLHGMTATTAEVRPLATFLHDRGYTVAGPLLPGHGTTPQELNRQHWKDWVASAEDAYQYLSSRCEQVLVGGESMGGLLALMMASRHPEIAAILLYAPALHIPGIERARFIAPFMRFIQKKGGGADIGWQGYYVNPTSAVAQLYLLQREVRKRLPNINQPVLIIQGRLDQTVNQQSAQIVYDRIGSKEKMLYWFDHSSHVVLLDKDFDRAAELTLKFVKTVVKS